MTAGAPMAEQWRPIPRIEAYEVSDLGRVRRFVTRRVMRQHINRWGYWQVALRVGDRSICKSTHALVARTFIGQRPANREVNHRNGVRTDNRAVNLEYVTALQNVRHAINMGLWPTGDRNGARTKPEKLSRGERHWASKLTAEIVSEIRTDHSRGLSKRAIARTHNVNPSSVDKVIRRKTWAHV